MASCCDRQVADHELVRGTASGCDFGPTASATRLVGEMVEGHLHMAIEGEGAKF